MPEQEFHPGDKAFDDFANVCMHRDSVRFYGTKDVREEDVLRLLSLAGHAPSVKNLQPWHFHVVMNRKLRTSLMEASCYGNFVEGAGAFIVVSCDTKATAETPDIIWNPRELEYSCVVAMTHVLLGASAMGLGSCWVSLHESQARGMLALKPGHSVVGGLMLGYPQKLDARETVMPRSIKPLKETYTLYP